MREVDVPVPPIVLDERGDIQVFPSVDAACRETEAIDVEAGVYDAFDGQGRRLRLSVSEGTVNMAIASTSSADAADLLDRLRRFVDRVGRERIGVPDPESAALPTLLAALLAFSSPLGRRRRLPGWWRTRQSDR